MTPNSHTSDDGAFLVATAGANPIDADSWSAPDHQSTAYQTPLAFQSDALGMISKFPDEAGVGMNAYDRDPSGWAAKEDWARHQALIKQLYLYEKKPLKEVMRYMEDQYDFRATSVSMLGLFFDWVADCPKNQNVQDAYPAMGPR